MHFPICIMNPCLKVLRKFLAPLILWLSNANHKRRLIRGSEIEKFSKLIQKNSEFKEN